MKIIIFILMLLPFTVIASGYYYLYACTKPLCYYTVIKQNPGSMRCPKCQDNYIFGKKINNIIE
jgi:PHP family Zn ribbon phosphoesterase